ncbi:hypothetical protein O181_074172 [Austropuccinia psidii MF-1]|uniref:Uncharacterized protein n=1 Tax=Austropuccinia psidii MF-1 TaxID=1389203 RepID=A0A9Q3FAF2_9BASI|nr:hypothetical protein [Austropuccinia psidii MF-1]
MSNFNREKYHSEGSDRHLHEPVHRVLQVLQGKRLGNSATNPPRCDELPEHPHKAPQKGGSRKILQFMESTIIQTSNQKHKALEKQKEGGNKRRIPVASTSKPQDSQPHQEGKKDKKKNLRKPNSPSYRIPRIQNDSMDNIFKIVRPLMEFKDKEEQRIRQSSFPNR